MGPPAFLSKKAVITCVLPVALFGTESMVRWPAIGDSRIRTRQAAIRTPFKNDRQSALASESFEAGNTKTWTRAGSTRGPLTRIQRLGLLIPETQRSKLLRPHFSIGCRTDPTEGLTKEEAAQAFKEWWRQLPPEDYTIFSDGSEQTIDRKHCVGYGYAIYRNGTQIAFPEQPDLDVYRQHISHLGHTRKRTAYNAMGLPQVSQSEAMKTTRYQDKVVSSGHMEIEGNEEADRLANAAAQLGPWTRQSTSCQQSAGFERSSARSAYTQRLTGGKR
ncbi:hypothetical protein DID88_007945 [Monilinia fructigena]|uniref:RNase H type-1 domain-containing protein n=1 Tax=Monilinia fructigena TaxID=38457 RepID=A0A395J3V2_9HELO|nr:hypothetical protein DID88_007945 [Monilinia fructigena]